MTISRELPWKHSWFEPVRFPPAACLQQHSVKVDPGSCQPWAGLWLQACPVRRLRLFVDLGGAEGSAPFLHRGTLFAWILTLPTPLTVSCLISNLQLYLRQTLIHRSALRDTFPSQPARRITHCYLSLSLPLSISSELSAHIALQLCATRLQAIAKYQLLLGRLLSSQISCSLAFKCREFTLNIAAMCQ